MGSLVNSLHIRCESADAVAVEIEAALAAQGYHRSEDPRQEPAAGSDRTVLITGERNGWVSVVEGDLMASLTLALELSARLETHAICLVVSGNASWHYELFHEGRAIDGYDSPASPPLLGLDEKPEEMLEMPDAVELTEAMATVGDQIPGIAEMLHSLLPAEMRQLFQRITEGTATKDDKDKFTQWTRELVEEAASQRSLSGRQSPVSKRGSDGNGKAVSRRAPGDHMHHLRSLLAPRFDGADLEKLLGTAVSAAEQPAGDFLEMLGIHRAFAQLNLQMLRSYAEDGQKAEIVLTRSLHFRKTA